MAIKSEQEALAAIQRVRELHIQETEISEFCEECLAIYPCPTIKALNGEQNDWQNWNYWNTWWK